MRADLVAIELHLKRSVKYETSVGNSPGVGVSAVP